MPETTRQRAGFSAERWTAWALFFVLLATYAYVFPRWADPNQNSRLDMVVAVVDDGVFWIDPYVANTVDYAKVGEHYYSDKAPGAAFVGIPVYAGLRLVLDTPLVSGLTTRLATSSAFQATLREEGSGVMEQKVRFALAQTVLTLVTAALPTAFLGVLIFKLLVGFSLSLGVRLTVALVYGLLTPAFAYAGAFYGHQLSAALLFWAFYLIFFARAKASPGRWFFTGLLLGYSVITEYPAALIVGVLSLYAAYRLFHQQSLPRLGWLILGGALVAAGWMVYNNAVFGGPFNLGYSYSELWQEQHHTGFLSLTWPRPEALWGITFGRFRGLFLLSPVLLLALPGFWLWLRGGKWRAEWAVAVAAVLLMLTFNAASAMWWGGFSVGPRYLLPMLPFLALGLGFTLHAWAARLWFKLLFGLLAAWSFVAVWGLTLAEQAYPPDTLADPLLEFALPNWQAGNVARNLGTLLGLTGPLSLIPLLAFMAAAALLWWALVYRPAQSDIR